MLKELIEAYTKQDKDKIEKLALEIISESSEKQLAILNQAIRENAPVEVILVLLEHGINCRQDPFTSSENTPIFTAVEAGRLEIVKLLISFKDKGEDKDKDNYEISLNKRDTLSSSAMILSPLEYCFYKCCSTNEIESTRILYSKIMAELLNAGANIDPLLENPHIFNIIWSENKKINSYFRFKPESCKGLTQSQILKRCSNAPLQKLMDHAVIRGDKDKLISYLNMGGDFIEKRLLEEGSPLSITLRAVTRGAIDLLQILFMHVPHDSFRKAGSTLLATALSKGKIEMACLFLLMGTSIWDECYGPSEYQSLYRARRGNIQEILKLASIMPLIPETTIQSIINKIEEAYINKTGDFHLQDTDKFSAIMDTIIKEVSEILHNNLKDQIAENAKNLSAVFSDRDEGDEEVLQLLKSSIRERILFHTFQGCNENADRKTWVAKRRNVPMQALYYKSIVEVCRDFVKCRRLEDGKSLEEQAKNKTDLTMHPSIMVIIHSYLPGILHRHAEGLPEAFVIEGSTYSERASFSREASLLKSKFNFILPIVQARYENLKNSQQEASAMSDQEAALVTWNFAKRDPKTLTEEEQLDLAIAQSLEDSKKQSEVRLQVHDAAVQSQDKIVLPEIKAENEKIEVRKKRDHDAIAGESKTVAEASALTQEAPVEALAVAAASAAPRSSAAGAGDAKHFSEESTIGHVGDAPKSHTYTVAPRKVPIRSSARAPSAAEEQDMDLAIALSLSTHDSSGAKSLVHEPSSKSSSQDFDLARALSLSMQDSSAKSLAQAPSSIRSLTCSSVSSFSSPSSSASSSSAASPLSFSPGPSSAIESPFKAFSSKGPSKESSLDPFEENISRIRKIKDALFSSGDFDDFKRDYKANGFTEVAAKRKFEQEIIQFLKCPEKGVVSNEHDLNCVRLLRILIEGTYQRLFAITDKGKPEVKEKLSLI